MLVVPLVSICIVKVIIEIDKNIKISSLLGVSLFWILFSTALAAIVGVILGTSFDLGSTFAIGENGKQIREIQSFSNIILGLIPSNIIRAINKENIIAIVIFSFFIGISAKKISKKEEFEQIFKSFQNFILVFYNIMMNMTATVIRFMPYAVVCKVPKDDLELKANNHTGKSFFAYFIGFNPCEARSKKCTKNIINIAI